MQSIQQQAASFSTLLTLDYLLDRSFVPKVVGTAPAPEAEAEADPAPIRPVRKPTFDELDYDLQVMVIADYLDYYKTDTDPDNVDTAIRRAHRRLCPLCGRPGCFYEFTDWFTTTF